MNTQIKTLFEILTGRGRVDIRRRVLRLVLFGCLLTFGMISVISLFGMIATWNTINERGSELSNSTADRAENFTEEQSKRHMLDVAVNKSRLIKFELENISRDTKLIAAEMYRIFRKPQDYPPRVLPDPREQTIRAGEVYAYKSPELRQNLTAELQAELNLSSNIANYLKSVVDLHYTGLQTSMYVSSKHGWHICVDSFRAERPIVIFSDDFLENYDPRVRPWYNAASNVDGCIFTDFYIGMDGYPLITCAASYYDTEGFAGVVGLDSSLGSLYRQVVDQSADGSDMNFVIDKSGVVLMSSQNEGTLAPNQKLGTTDTNLLMAIEKMTAGESGVEDVTIDGKDYFLAFAPVQIADWSFGTLLDKREVLAPAAEARGNILLQMDEFKQSLGNVFVISLIVSIILLTVLMRELIKIGVKMADRFVEPIHQLSDGVRDIASGDFGKTLDIHTGDEIEHLSICFNAMTNELKTYTENLKAVTAEKERVATELDVATEIQSGMLPHDFDFDRSDFEIYATMNAAKEVGGDFYDFYLLDDDRLMITIADVSGKGIAAALFMVISKTILKNFAMTLKSADDLGAMVACANQQLCQNNDAMMFATAFVGLLDLKTGKFTYVNGGHNPPMIYSARKDQWRYLETVERNYALGLMDDADYAQETIDLEDGDVIYLYTDGLTEALNEREELYGDDRLEQCLNRVNVKNLSVEEVLEEVRRSLDEYVGNAAQSDDITMLAVRLGN